MPKPSIFDVKRTEKTTVIAATDDLMLIRVDIESVKGVVVDGEMTYRLATSTVLDLMTLQNHIRRGWKIIATTPHESALYRSIVYTLYKPLEW